MRTLLAAVASFLIPGLGQLFMGKVGWALVWLVSTLMCGVPLTNVLAALHVLFIGSDDLPSSRKRQACKTR